MKPLYNHVVTLTISLCILAFSFRAVLNLSTMPIESYASALWGFVAMTLTMLGLLVSPVLVLVSFGNIVKNTMKPERKGKQKNDI